MQLFSMPMTVRPAGSALVFSAHLSKTLFQVRNLTGQFRPFVAKSADDMSLGHDLSP
jgi:hypothetical protein